ncbi:MAG: translation initiation factor IF-2 subunit beta [Candidatus Aenigmatarchaeota archaeon]
MQSYEELLKKAMEKMPKKKEGGERFEVPKVESIIQGHQTIIRNLGQIAEALRREQKHLLKYLSKALAAPINVDGTRAIIQGKIPQRTIQKKLENYVKEYVLCKECGKPDTKIEKEDRISFLKCEACGAKGAVKGI